MIKELVKLANHLDAKGLRKEADYLDKVIAKFSMKKNKMLIFLTVARGVPHDNDALRSPNIDNDLDIITKNIATGAVSAKPHNLVINTISQVSGDDLDKIDSLNTTTQTGEMLGYDFVLIPTIQYNKPTNEGHKWQFLTSIVNTKTKDEVISHSYVVYTEGTSLDKLHMVAVKIASRVVREARIELMGSDHG